jgi:uncharacterized membrane protein YgcG
MLNLLKWPFLLLWRLLTLGAGRGRIGEVADRIARHGDRFANARQNEKASIARQYSGRARNAFTVGGAESLEEDFLVAVGLKAARQVREALESDANDLTRDSWLRNSSSNSRSSESASSGFVSSSSSSDSSSSESSVEAGGGSFGGGGASGGWDNPSDNS